MSPTGKLPVVILAAALVLLPIVADSQIALAQEGYFSKGDKKVPVVSAGSRSSDEKTVLLSLLGATLAVGTVGSYYALDARSLSDKVSESRDHTNLAWSPQRDGIYNDADRSAQIAQITLGISGALFASAIAVYVITSPDSVETSREMRARLQSIPTLSIPKDGGFLVRQRWSY